MKLPSDNFGVARDDLRRIIDGIESLETEKEEIATQRKAILAEAKATGFNTKIINKLIARRKRKKEELDEEEALLETYEAAMVSAEFNEASEGADSKPAPKAAAKRSTKK